MTHKHLLYGQSLLATGLLCPSIITTPPHLHFLVTEGGVDESGTFHRILRIDDSRLAELFAREVLGFLVHKQLLSPEWAERLLSWRHTGFNAHSRVRAKTKKEAERVGKYMIRPLLSLERLSFSEKGQVCYQYGKEAKEVEAMDDLEFIARVTSHIPDKGQVTVRYYGLYANAHRGKVRKASLEPFPLRMVEEELRRPPAKGWVEMIRKVYEVVIPSSSFEPGERAPRSRAPLFSGAVGGLDRPGDSRFTKLMNFTLFGYPRTGKTTLFNILTGAREDEGAFGEIAKEPHHRTCALPDERLENLLALYPDKKKTPAAVDVTDLAGISYGEVKGSLFLNALRKSDVLIHVVRAFRNPSVPYPKEVAPAADIKTMEEELTLSDFLSVEVRLEKLDKDLKKARSPEGEKERALLERMKPVLESGRRLYDIGLSTAEEKTVRSFAFLSQKPLLHILNLDEAD